MRKREGKGGMKSRNLRERRGKPHKRWGAYPEENSERIGEKLMEHGKNEEVIGKNVNDFFF